MNKQYWFAVATFIICFFAGAHDFVTGIAIGLVPAIICAVLLWVSSRCIKRPSDSYLLFGFGLIYTIILSVGVHVWIWIGKN